MALLPNRFSFPLFVDLQSLPLESVLMRTPFANMRLTEKDNIKVIAIEKTIDGKEGIFYITNDNYELAKRVFEHETFVRVQQFASAWAENAV